MSRQHLTCALFGVAFGGVFAAAGFNQYDMIHRLPFLENLTPFLKMGSAVMTAMVTLWALERRGWRTPLGRRLELRRWPVERKRVLGGVMFGTGWAITGACPGTASTMLGGGRLLGVMLVVGMVAGIALHDVAVAPREQRRSLVVTEPARS